MSVLFTFLCHPVPQKHRQALPLRSGKQVRVYEGQPSFAPPFHKIFIRQLGQLLLVYDSKTGETDFLAIADIDFGTALNQQPAIGQGF